MIFITLRLVIIPNSTPVPNYFVDTLMPKLSGSAFKVLLAITRQTLGWIEDPITKKRKEKDWISYSQLSEKTGLYKQAITKAIRELENFKVIDILNEEGQFFEAPKDRRGKRLIYRLNTNMGENHPSMGENQWVKITHTKETNTKVNNILILKPNKKPYFTLEEISEEDIREVAERYGVPEAFVRNKYEDMVLWAGEKSGRGRGRNWRLTLMNWVKRDAVKFQNNNSQTITQNTPFKTLTPQKSLV